MKWLVGLTICIAYALPTVFGGTAHAGHSYQSPAECRGYFNRTLCIEAYDPLNGDHLLTRVEFCHMNTSDSTIDSDGDRTTTGTQDGCEAASLSNDRAVNSGDQALLGREIAREPNQTLRLRNFDINKDGGVNSRDQLAQVLFFSPIGQCP